MTEAGPACPTPDARPGGLVTFDETRPGGRLLGNRAGESAGETAASQSDAGQSAAGRPGSLRGGSRLSGSGLAHPFITVHPFGWTVARSWSDGRDDDGAAAVAQIVPPDGGVRPPVLVGVGAPARLAELLDEVAGLAADLGPRAVSLTRGTGEHVGHVLAGWGLAERSSWDRLATERLPEVPPGTPDPAAVEVLDVIAGQRRSGPRESGQDQSGQRDIGQRDIGQDDIGQGECRGSDAAAIEACLAVSNPTTTHRPGDPHSTWYGWRDPEGSLAAVVCSTTPRSGGLAHLGAIGTRPDRRGRGLAAAVTARATADGVGEHGLVILSMYDDNHTARRLYERLGFVILHEVETWRPSRA